MMFYSELKKYAKVNAYYGIAFDEFHMPVHMHNSCELMYIGDGSCIIHADGDTLTLHKNQLIFIDPNIPHQLTIEKSHSCTVFCVEAVSSSKKNGIDLHEVFRNCSGFANFVKYDKNYMVLSGNDNMCYAVKDLIAEQEKGQKKSEYLCDLLLAKMFIELSRCYENSSQLTGIVHLNRAKEYILQNYCFDLNVDMVACAAKVHPAYLQVLFHEYLSCGIKTFVNNVRLEKAKFMLRNTKTSITQIAFEIGFNSRQHFGYTFEKRISMSPMQYRKLKGLVFEVNTKTFKNTNPE